MNRTKSTSMYRAMRLVACLAVLSMLFTACKGAPAPSVKQAEMVATAAVQTLTAIPRDTAAAPKPPTPEPPTATSEPTATAEPTQGPPTPTPVLSAVGPTNFPANVNPLTGMPVADQNLLNRRPVLIKISNWPAVVRPQSGLASADIVFEYYMGEGMNRFVALFYGQDATKVGSIRSGRMPDAQLGPLYQAVLASSGAYITVERAIEAALGNRVINEGAGACPMFCRDEKISSPNNLFGNSAEISKYAQTHNADPKVKQKLDGMAFDPAAPTAGKAATDVSIVINDIDKGEWKYDAASHTYLRFIDNLDANGKVTMVPLGDANTKKQLGFNNVVVIYANYVKTANTIYDITLSQLGVSGKAIVYRDGKAIEGTWKSQGPTAPLAFIGVDGKPLPFKPGNSWFVFMNTGSTTTENAGTWNVQLVIQ